MAWYDNHTPLVGDTYKGPVSDRYTGPKTVNWGSPTYNAPSTFDYYHYEPPVQYEAPVIQYTPPKIDYSPQIANIADKFKSQLQNIQNGVILPASQLAPYINQTPLVGQTKIDIKPLTGVEQKDIIRNWAENQISILETIGTQEATMLKTQKELDDLVELSIGAMSFVGDVYDNLKTTIDTHADIPQFKLTPLASHTVTAAMEELKWRQNKVDLNSILPKMDKTVQKQLIAEDTIKRNEEYLKTHDQMKTNLYTAAKTYYNADADVLREMFASDKSTANIKDIERVQFYFNPANKNEVKAFEQRTGTDFISGNVENTLYRYNLSIAKTDTGIVQQAALGASEAREARLITDASGKPILDTQGNKQYTMVSTQRGDTAKEIASAALKQQTLDAATQRNKLLEVTKTINNALATGKTPMQIQIGDSVSIDFSKGTLTAYGTETKLKTTDTTPRRQVESYTKTVQDFATNTDNAVLKTAANGFLALFASDDERMANAGLKVGYEQLKDMGKGEGQQDWSVFHSILSASKYVIGNISGRITGIESEKKTLEQAYLGETNYYITDDGKTAANAAGKQWAETGKVGDIAGISSNAAKLMVLENADKNTVADIALNRQKDLAILAYNPFTKPVVMNALGKELTNEIISQNPLTQKEIESVNSDLMKSGMKAAVDQRLTGTFLDVPIGMALAITGGGIVANELELLAKGAKAASNMVKRAEDITDLVHYAKTASVLAKDSDLANTAILKATKASNIAVVTPSPGTIARGVTTNSIDIKKASSIEVTAAKAPLADKATAVKVKEFNADVQRAVAQPNVAAPSILTKTQTPGTSKTTNAQKLMDNIANGDASTIRAALVENIATDPSSLYKAMTVAAVKSEPDTVARAFQRLEEANQIYVRAANDLVKDVVDSGKGATRLAELSNSLGDAPVIKMLDTAMGMGETGARIEPTPLINEITNIRREWETLRKIESTPVSVAPTGARHISQQAYDIENVMPDNVRDRVNRYLVGAGTGKQINRIEDIAALSDGEIKQVAKKYSDVQIGTNVRLEQALLNYREKASQILGKEGTALEDVTVTAFQKKEETSASWSMGEKNARLDNEYKALFSADNLQSVVTEKKGDIEKLQTAAQRSIGRPLDTMDDFKSLTNKEIDALSKNVPSVSKSDITGYRVQATKEMDKLSQVRQTYDKLGTEDYTNLVKLQQQRAADLASTADEYRNLLRNTERTADQERRMGQLGIRLEEQRSILQATTEAIDARKMQMEQWKTKQLTAADIKPGTKDRKTAAINAIDAAKKGDYETAIKKFAEARTHDGRSVLSKVDAKHYDGMSIQRINRMEDAVPADQMSKGMKEMLERMRQERRDFAIGELKAKGGDFKGIANKIDMGDDLDELERLKLWNSGDEIRALAKDALDDVNGNKLVKGLVDDAVKKGDAARAKNLKTSMKEELEKCIKRGECGGGATAAAAAVAPIGKTLSAVGGSMVGLGMLAAAGLGVGMINSADGKMWKKDENTNTFYEVVPDGEVKSFSPFDYDLVEVGYKQMVTDDAVGAYNTLKDAGIIGREYSYGEKLGVQGRNIDKDEYICQNYTIDGVNAINKNSEKTGIVAKAVNVIGSYSDGKSINHSLIALENRNEVIGSYTDRKTGEQKNIYKTTLIDPQTGETSQPGWDFTGKTMSLNGKDYKIEALQTMDNPRQEMGSVFSKNSAYMKGDNVTLYSTESKETPGIDDALRQDLSTVQQSKITQLKESISDTYKIDPWQTISDLDTEVK